MRKNSGESKNLKNREKFLAFWLLAIRSKREKQKPQKQNCETVKLWLQVVDSEGSTVSQFQSFTNWHGGVGSELRGVGSLGRGVGKKQGK
jgi:hypothetical protein